MNEIRRLAYLEAMDIPTYVSRVDLPGAAPSRRLRVLAGAPAAAETMPTAPAMDLAPPLDVPEPRGGSRPGPAAAEAPARVMPDTPVFAVAATEAGGWLWIDEVPPGREPGAEYAQLLAAICRALGLPDAPSSTQLFSYPVAGNPALAGGLEEARQALFGFLSGRVGRGRPGRVVLLGELKEAWFDIGFVADIPLTRTVSAWGMLRDPRLKAQAWKDLRPLRSDAG